jgi:hypothetical protein
MLLWNFIPFNVLRIINLSKYFLVYTFFSSLTSFDKLWCNLYLQSCNSSNFFLYSYLWFQGDTEHTFDDEAGPLTLNAFDLIILSQGLNLAALFDRRQVFMQATCDAECFRKEIIWVANCTLVYQNWNGILIANRQWKWIWSFDMQRVNSLFVCLEAEWRFDLLA